MTSEFKIFDEILPSDFAKAVSTMYEWANTGSVLRLALAPGGEKFWATPLNERFATVWSRDLQYPVAQYPRWLKEELFALRRASKKRQNRLEHAEAGLLGMFGRYPSRLGQRVTFRYLLPQHLTLPPPPYPVQGTWDPQREIAHDPDWIRELLHLQRPGSEWLWLDHALRRCRQGRWTCACSLRFGSEEQRLPAARGSRRAKAVLPELVELWHPSEGRVELSLLPQGDVHRLTFSARTILDGDWPFDPAGENVAG